MAKNEVRIVDDLLTAFETETNEVVVTVFRYLKVSYIEYIAEMKKSIDIADSN